MKPLNLLDSFGNIPEKYILEAKDMGKFEKTRKPRWGAFLAAAIAVSLLAVTAYAAGRHLGIWDMTKDTSYALPSGATEYIQTQTVREDSENWSCSLVESLFDERYFLLTVGVSCSDDYVLAPAFSDASSPVSDIGLDGTETLEEYAARQGKQLLFVNANMKDRDKWGIDVQNYVFKRQSDSEATILLDGQKNGEYTSAEATCSVTAFTDANNPDEYQRKELTFPTKQIPGSEGKVLVADNPNAVPGIVVRSVTVSENVVGTTLDFDGEIVDEALAEPLKIGLPREVTFKEGGGWVENEPGKLSAAPWLVEGSVQDTLTVDYYNWDNEIIGTIVFTLK